MTFNKLACGSCSYRLRHQPRSSAADEEMNTNTQARPTGIRASIDRAAASLSAQPSVTNHIPVSLPRRAKVSKGMGAG